MLELIKKIDALSRRERIYLLVTLLLVTGMGWKYLISDTMRASQKAAVIKSDKIAREVRDLNTRKEFIINNPQQDPNEPLQRQWENEKIELTRLEKQLQEAENNLSSPAEMAKTLERLLNKMDGLSLVGVQSLPSERLELDKIRRELEETETDQLESLEKNDDELLTGQSVTLFRHGMVMTFSGNYLDTVKFLRELEGQSTTFFWDNIDYKLQEDHNKVQLSINTLSFVDGFLGVNLKMDQQLLTSSDGDKLRKVSQLFDPTARVDKKVVDIAGDQEKRLALESLLNSIQLTSILISPFRKVAIINNRIFQEGEMLDGMLLSAIDPKAIHLEINGGIHQINLKKFNSIVRRYASTEDVQ